MSASSASAPEACECAICYEEIVAAQTGSVVLSCSHNFHFSCISRWFGSQEKGSCPCCRKEMGEKEDFHAAAEEEDEEDDDEEDEDEEPYTAWLSKTRLLEVLYQSGASLNICEIWDTLVRKLPIADALWPGDVRLEFCEDELRFLILGLGGRYLRNLDWELLLDAEEVPMSGAFNSYTNEVWRVPDIWNLKEDGTWTLQVHNPEEMTGVCAVLPPLTPLVPFVEKTATKIQAVWRGYAARHAHALAA